MDIPKHFVEVRKNVFLSKSDPLFYRKYLNFFPNDRVMLFEYANQLETQGNIKESVRYYKKSAELGYPLAKRKVSQIEGNQKRALLIQQLSVPNRTNHDGFKWLFALLLLTLLFFLLYGLLHYQWKQYVLERVDHYYYHENVIHETSSVKALSPNKPPLNKKVQPVYSKEDLTFIVLVNAIERYKQEEGHYPSSLSTLTRNLPNNRISFLPLSKDFFYENLGSKYSLSTSKPLRDSYLYNLLELDFYPKSHKLAVMQGNTLLALYSVADGKNPLPFQSSKVSLRVINPNGGSGALGTRGLALQDNFAIHGTNQPDSIGKSVSLGCIRMKNQDIENLYPYISVGTPFKVQEGNAPSSPMFPNGLPNLLDGKGKSSPNRGNSNPNPNIGNPSSNSETSPNLVYHWKK